MASNRRTLDQVSGVCTDRVGATTRPDGSGAYSRADRPGADASRRPIATVGSVARGRSSR